MSADPLFIVGCPRSGTTWMQLLLAQHPAVATANETFLFYRYVGPLLREWEAEADRYVRDVGLRQVLDEEEFRELCRAFATGVVERMARPDTELVVEKTPGHVSLGREILACFPDAYLLHVIRDPRDVAASFLAAGESWAGSWARSSPHDTAHLWKRLVTDGRAISDLTGRYREVRYEDLEADAAGELRGVLEWTGLPFEASFPREAARACAIDSVREGREQDAWDTGEEPEGFFRKGTSGGWREELSAGQVHTVEYVAGDLMRRLGYEPTSRLLSLPPLAELRNRISSGVRRLWRG